jgi:hypothetical protein
MRLTNAKLGLKAGFALCLLWGVMRYLRHGRMLVPLLPGDVSGLRGDTVDDTVMINPGDATSNSGVASATTAQSANIPSIPFLPVRGTPRTPCTHTICPTSELCQSEANVMTGVTSVPRNSQGIDRATDDATTVAAFRLGSGRVVQLKLRWSFTFPLNVFSSPQILTNSNSGSAGLASTRWIVVALGEEGSEDVFNVDTGDHHKPKKQHTHRGYATLLNFSTGETRWCTEPLKAGRSNELFGTPAVLQWPSPEAAADSELAATLVVGGRGGQLHGLDASTGRLVWTWQDRASDPVHVRELNWFSPCVTPDLDGDGFPDFINTYAGDHLIPKCVPEPGKCLRRPPGFLVVVSGATGQEIARATVPNGSESYMSPLLYCAQAPQQKRKSGTGHTESNRIVLEESLEPCARYSAANEASHGSAGGVDGVSPAFRVVVGTGGESMAGSLWVVPLRSVLQGTMDDAVEIVQPMPGPHQTPQGGTGMIAPPALADVNGDGVLDIVHAAFDGRVGATDGLTLKPLWSVSLTKPYESWTFAAPAVGRMAAKDALDVFAVVNGGHWFEPGPDDPPDAKPEHVPARRVMLDGRTGKTLWANAPSDQPVYASVGSSPLTADLDGDGLDEVIYFLGALHVGANDESTTASTTQAEKRGPFCMDTDLIVLARKKPEDGQGVDDSSPPVEWEELVVAHFENAVVPSTPALVMVDGAIAMVAALR